MPLHPSIDAWLRKSVNAPVPGERTPEGAYHSLTFGASQEGPADGLDDVFRIEIPSPGGHLSLLHYPAHGRDSLNGLVWFEDTGFLSDTSSPSPSLSRLVKACGWSLTVVEARGIPQHYYPSAHRDAEAALRWVLENPGELNISGLVAVGGEGTGGMLAAIAASKLGTASDIGPVSLVLVNPLLDALLASPSCESYREGYGLTLPVLRGCLDRYFPEDLDRKDSAVSPFWANSFAGQVRTFVAVAEFDILRDEAEAYVQFLEDEGCDVSMSFYEGMIHGFMRLGALVADSDALFADIAGFLNHYDSG